MSLIVRSSDCADAHGFAVLVGAGATAVNPWLAQEIIQDRLDQGLYPGMTLSKVFLNYKGAIEAGLMKVLARKGISVISSYRGGLEFEAVGLSRALAAEFFPGLTSRVSGIGLAGLGSQGRRAARPGLRYAQSEGPARRFLQAARRRRGPLLRGQADPLAADATTRGDYRRFKAYSDLTREVGPVNLRDLLAWRSDLNPVPIDEVETVNEIRKRFLTPGMSLGALSPEAHEVMNIAMNRIGARSVSGEGGEDPERYLPRPNGDNANSAVK